MRIPRREDEMFNLDREGLRMCITSFAAVFSFVETVTWRIDAAVTEAGGATLWVRCRTVKCGETGRGWMWRTGSAFFLLFAVCSNIFHSFAG